MTVFTAFRSITVLRVGPFVRRFSPLESAAIDTSPVLASTRTTDVIHRGFSANSRGGRRGSSSPRDPPPRRPPRSTPRSPPKPRRINPPPASTAKPSARGGGGKATGADPNLPRNPQEFVRIRFEPGQWDIDHTDPLFMPPRRDRADLISADDFANRPTAGFTTEFASLRDARFVLSWLGHDRMDDIYNDYVSIMERMHKEEKGGTTSHEYIVNVLARKHNLMPDRIAAIVALRHNEEQIKSEGGETFDHLAKRIDEEYSQHIREVYASYNEVDPREFVEDQLITSKGSQENVSLDDLYDLDDIERKSIMRDREEAQKIIDTKVYIEDLDESKIECKVNKECGELVEAHRAFSESRTDYSSSDATEDGNGGVPGEAVNPVAGRRPRWKFVAHIINTREENELKKKRRRRGKKYRGTGEKNTIVEHNGHLRVATLEELGQTSWKPPRSVKETFYRDAKRGWIAKTSKGSTEAWGRAP